MKPFRIALLIAACAASFSAAAQTPPSFPTLPSYPGAPSLPGAPQNVTFNENYQGPSPTPAANIPNFAGNPNPAAGIPGQTAPSADAAGGPSSKMLTQSKSAPQSQAKTIAVADSVNDGNAFFYNQRNGIEADKAWSEKSFAFSERLYNENKPTAPAASYSDHRRALYPWISMMRSLGYPESKINLELSRQAPEEFIEWTRRVQD